MVKILCIFYISPLLQTFVSLLWHTNSDGNETPQVRGKDPQSSFQLWDLKAQEVKHFQFSISQNRSMF